MRDFKTLITSESLKSDFFSFSSLLIKDKANLRIEELSLLPSFKKLI